MRVELDIDENLDEAFAVLHIKKLSSTIQSVVEILKKEENNTLFTVRVNEKIMIIDPLTVSVIHAEGREIVIYDQHKRRYTTSKTLNELDEILGDDFVRISKSAIINLYEIDHVEASFNATMEVTMNNGIEEIITRSFCKQFKKRLGV